MEELYLHFNVIGAGKIRVSQSSGCSCGGEKGFSFGVEWGDHGYTGGVLPKEEALKLAHHIIATLRS